MNKMSISFQMEEYLAVECPEYDIFIRVESEEVRTSRGKELLQKLEVKPVFTLNVKFVNGKIPTNTKKTGGKEETIVCSYDDVLNGILQILNMCENHFSRKTPKILIDITGFVAPYLFNLLKQLSVVKKVNSLDAIYTAPLTYNSNRFSEGIRKIREIKDFYGATDATLETLLVSIIGFEGYRSLEVMQELDPNKTIAVNGFPPYSLELKDTSILENKDLLNHPSCFNNIMMASANDPFHTQRVLNTIYRDNRDNYNITISPLGTKPMSLGACIFCLNHPDVRVVFPYPTKYSEANVTSKFGRTWIYKIPKLIL